MILQRDNLIGRVEYGMNMLDKKKQALDVETNWPLAKGGEQTYFRITQR